MGVPASCRRLAPLGFSLLREDKIPRGWIAISRQHSALNKGSLYRGGAGGEWKLTTKDTMKMRMWDSSICPLWRLSSMLIEARKLESSFRDDLKFSATRGYKILRLSIMY